MAHPPDWSFLLNLRHGSLSKRVQKYKCAYDIWSPSLENPNVHLDQQVKVDWNDASVMSKYQNYDKNNYLRHVSIVKLAKQIIRVRCWCARANIKYQVCLPSAEPLYCLSSMWQCTAVVAPVGRKLLPEKPCPENPAKLIDSHIILRLESAERALWGCIRARETGPKALGETRATYKGLLTLHVFK